VCRALAERGHQVVCFTGSTADPDFPDPEPDLNFEVCHVPPLNSRTLGKDLRSYLYNIRLNQALEERFKWQPPDFVYERYALYGSGTLKWAIRRSVPHMLEINTFLVKEQAHRLHFPRIAQWHEHRIWRMASSVIAVSYALGESIQSLLHPDATMEVMPMAVDPDRFGRTLRESTENPFAELEELRDKLVLVYAGALTAWHGVASFLDMAKVWKEEGLPVHLVLLGGDKKQAAAYRKRIKNRELGEEISALGSVPSEEIPRYLAWADAGIIAHTSKFSSPTKLFEYMASGLPVIAPDQPSIRRVISDEEHGFLFPAEEPEAAARLIKHFLGEEGRARIKTMGAAGRSHVETHHTWDQVVQRIEQMHDTH
jgi:glycosyltransferase involved in cell wall biosynthesis